MDIIKDLKKLRLKANLTQQELATKLKIDRRTVINWENKHSVPRLFLLSRLEEVLKGKK